jgi:UDP-N-acetylglucosamine transferase subunit ALG13
MIFLTVGTSFPFNRLVQMVDEAVREKAIGGDLFAQVGIGGAMPSAFPSVESMEKKQFDEYFDRAEAIIAHAGMGTITMALDRRKPILVVPRLRQYREIVNDHQVHTARNYEEMGYVLAAYSKEELIRKWPQLKTFVPKERKASPEKVSGRIGEFLLSVMQNRDK